MEAHHNLEYQKIKGDKTYVEAPGCGGPWTALSSGAVEAHPTLEYPKIKGDKTYVEAPGCGGPWATENLLPKELCQLPICNWY